MLKRNYIGNPLADFKPGQRYPAQLLYRLYDWLLKMSRAPVAEVRKCYPGEKVPQIRKYLKSDAEQVGIAIKTHQWMSWGFHCTLGIN